MYIYLIQFFEQPLKYWIADTFQDTDNGIDKVLNNHGQENNADSIQW